MNRPHSRLPVVAAVVVLAVVGYFGWQHFKPTQAPALVEAPVVPTPLEPQAATEPALPDPSAIQHPIESIAEASPTTADTDPLPALAISDTLVGERLAELLSRQDLLTFWQTDGFVRRVVATVDNLARSHASTKLWPVNPTPERFSTRRGADGVETIHPDNRQRYAPLVHMIEAVDTAKAVAVYRSLYPLFQRAYEELGFPDAYFNDRLVQVLDHLIATPVPTGPLAITLVEVKGTVPSLRPWVRYEFADPALESLSSGRKMLLRTGADNQRRLQAKLKDIRQRVAKP
ncbi:DUF3014 domain-containing protein [Hydrogenophaga sp.]|uniref:DUF3014 domain-containing protein n=1 Tax=Hydrogenophaga sp. TaxID=1904254 RepID=UPI003566EA2F